jgi:hypothetical protein
MNSYYGQPPQREENNNLGTAIGVLGAGALAGFGGRALYKNINARKAKAKATGGPRGGQGGTATRDNPTAAEVYGSLSNEAKPTKGQVYDRVNRQPTTAFEYEEYDFPLRKASQRQTVVDTDTGEIIARGGPTAYYQQFDNVPTGNTKTPELYLSRPLDAYLESLPTKQETTKGGALAVIDSAAKTSLASGPKLLPGSGPLPQLQSREQAVYGRAANKYPDPGVGKDVQYRFPGGSTDQPMLITDESTGQIFRRGGGLSELEQKAGASNQPVVKTAAYEEGSAVDKLMQSLLPEVNKEAGQMTATESSRQTRALDKEDQRLARGILADMKEEQPTTLVQVQESREPQVAVNAMETVNTADDQSDGRFLRNLQRNEDVNMAAVSEAVVDNKEAVLDSRISDALSYLRGKEIDTNFDYSAEEAKQARQVGQRFERAQALQSLGNQVIDEVQAEGVIAKPVEAAQDFLTTRRENLAAKGGVGPARVEQQLATDVVGKTGFGARAMSDVATPSNLKKYESVSNLGPDAVVKKAASGTSIRGRSRSVDEPDAINRQRSSTPEFQDVSVSVTGEPFEQGLDTQSVVGFTNEPTQAVRSLPATGQRTTTGQLRDLTPEQKDIVYGADTVRGALPLGGQERAPRSPVRRFQETLTETQEELVNTDGGGVGIGVYGLETDYTPGAVRYDGSYSAAAEQKPTEYRVSSRKPENAPNAFAGLSDEQLGQVSMQGTEAEAYNADKMLAKRRSFDVAQDIRRIQNSGRPDAQQQVKSYLDELMANEIPGVDFS